MIGEDWSSGEIGRIVEDYFDMLSEELAGARVRKTKHRNRLKERLDRSDKSIEYKHMNISAVMTLMGLPHISGYRPAFHYQHVLAEHVDAYLQDHPDLLLKAQSQGDASPMAAARAAGRTREQVEVPAPEGGLPTPRRRAESLANEEDMLRRESRNRRLGRAGEEFVLNHEKLLLSVSRNSRRTADVKWMSKIRGEGLGYDILSFDATTGEERFVEVKTTNLRITTPFFLSRNELKFSQSHSDAYVLARVFDFYEAPRLFRLRGALDRTCELEPTTYKAAAV
jgi:hypothetical protein